MFGYFWNSLQYSFVIFENATIDQIFFTILCLSFFLLFNNLKFCSFQYIRPCHQQPVHWQTVRLSVRSFWKSSSDDLLVGTTEIFSHDGRRLGGFHTPYWKQGNWGSWWNLKFCWEIFGNLRKNPVVTKKLITWSNLNLLNSVFLQTSSFY